MPILTRHEILDRLDQTDLRKKLLVSPLLDRKRQVSLNSIDVRLGTDFIVIQQTNLTCVDPAHGKEFEQNLGRYQERVQLSFGEPFILHPGQLVLGCTLEFIGLPEGVCGQILGRSSWGRLGLISATAPFIASGFRGVVTLELENLGQIPVVVYPGYMIAQLVLQETSGVTPYEGKYSSPTTVEYAKLSAVDPKEEIDFWSNSESFGRAETDPET